MGRQDGEEELGGGFDEGVSSKVGLRVRPQLTVGTTQVPFPNHITLEKKTGSSNSSSTNTSRKG